MISHRFGPQFVTTKTIVEQFNSLNLHGRVLVNKYKLLRKIWIKIKLD